MGQATLDLPDPTQLSGISAGPLSPQALASADDLLSQLAGDDIDRLLAEADAERSAAPPPASPPAAVAPAPTPAPAVAPPQVPALPVPAAALEVAVEAEKVADDEAATAAAIDAILAPAIDSTLKAVEQQPAAPEQPAAPVAPPVELHEPSFAAVDQQLLNEAAAHVASIMDPPPAEPEPAAAIPAVVADAAERQALSEPLILPPPQGRSPGRLWLLVKILEWINAPMLLFSDEVREGMGKVAIVTTFNAAAVLVYVMAFRRHH